MSFQEKIAGLMARPGQDAVPKDDVPWYLKYAGRILGIVGAFFAILFGLYNCFSVLFLSVSCLISGILQMLAGFLVMAIEAPCCCMFIDYVQQLAEKADQRPYWNRAAVYCIVAIPPVIMCPGLASIFGCGLIFGTGVLYGMMSVGKKGTREDMAAVASPTALSPGQGPTSTDQHTTLMEDPDVWRPTASAEDMRNAAIQSGLAPTTPTTNDRANIINNAQPFSFTGAVATDSNV